MKARKFSTGFPCVDDLVEGLRPGDNVLFHAESFDLYRLAVRAAVSARPASPQHPLLYIRWKGGLDDCVGALSAERRFECQDGRFRDAPKVLRKELEIWLKNDQHDHCFVVFDDLNSLCAIPEGLLAFYQPLCSVLYQLRAVAYWPVPPEIHAETIATLRDHGQVFIRLSGSMKAPILHVQKVFGRYSERMHLPHRLNPRTGQLTPLETSGSQDQALVAFLGDKLRELRTLRNQLDRALEEERTVAELSLCALTDAPVDRMFQEAVERVSHVLSVSTVHILEFGSQGKEIGLCAGIGWEDGLVGTFRMNLPSDFPFRSFQDLAAPVVTDEAQHDPRTAWLPLLSTHRLTSGLLAPIHVAGRFFGLLGAYTIRPRRFWSGDAQFLQSVANLLSLAVERHEIQEAWQSSRAHFQCIIELVEDAIISCDTHQRITLFNSAAAHMFGYRPEEILGRPLDHLIPVISIDAHRRHFVDFAKTSEVIRPMARRSRITARRKDGTEFPARATIGKFQVGGEWIFNVRLQDLTDAVRNEARLREAEEQLRQAQKMEALGTLAGGIAHDFNNVLTPMLGYAELSSRVVSQLPFHPQTSQTVHGYLQQILRAGTRAKSLIRRILAFSRQAEPERAQVHLASLVEETVAFLRASIPSSISLNWHCAAKEVRVWADPVQIQQVLMNLLVNAEYALRGKEGEIEVILDEVQIPSEQKHAHLAPGSYVELRIRDTGSGIPEEVLPRIFEPFFTTKPVTEGTGLGLSVAYGIIAHHGGSMTVASTPGDGATFEILLPCLAEEETAASPVKREDHPLDATGCILFVDDEEMIAACAGEFLRHLGYETIVKTDPREALQTFREDPWRIDLVITDQTMPHLSGERLAQEMVHLRPDIPVILCTGYHPSMTAERARTLGLAAYAAKPLTGEEFERLVQHVLRKARGRREEGKSGK